MKYFKLYYLVGCLACLGLCSYGQDKVYFKDTKVEECLVKEITPAYLKGLKREDLQNSYTVNLSDVLFVFNKAGNFLVISGLFDDQLKAERYIKKFFSNGTNAFRNADQVITVNYRIISCTLTAENQRTLEYILNGKKDSIAKNDVALIIYKDGSHRLLANVNKSFKALQAINDKYNEVAFTYDTSKDQQVIAQGKNVSFTTTGDTPVGSKTNQLVADTEEINQSGSVPAVHKRNSKGNMELDSLTRISLKNKAIMHIKELETYLKIISDKDLNTDQVQNAITQAQTLFINGDALIEVSSKNRSNIQLFKVPLYLNRLAFIKYRNVQIEWYNIQYASKFRINPDGTYTGIIELEQKFTGMANDKKVYEDITRKTVEVYMQSFNKLKGGEMIQEWNVFLGNIGISVADSK